MEKVITIILQNEQKTLKYSDIFQLLMDNGISVDTRSYKKPVAVQNDVAIFKPLDQEHAHHVCEKVSQLECKGEKLMAVLIERKIPRQRTLNALTIRLR